jgi:predicted 3-demethylubiquinone-9 3-methyltransferase (glyoxalase superfamily)
MNQSVQPFLMFQGKVAEEALKFYVSIIPASEITHIVRYGAGQPGPEGSVMVGTASLGGLDVKFSDSYVKHAFTFTPSLSLFYTCRSEEEQNKLFAALEQGGEALMGLANYGFSRRFGWLNDRFGVSWQLNLE